MKRNKCLLLLVLATTFMLSSFAQKTNAYRISLKYNGESIDFPNKKWNVQLIRDEKSYDIIPLLSLSDASEILEGTDSVTVSIRKGKTIFSISLDTAFLIDCFYWEIRLFSNFGKGKLEIALCSAVFWRSVK